MKLTRKNEEYFFSELLIKQFSEYEDIYKIICIRKFNKSYLIHKKLFIFLRDNVKEYDTIKFILNNLSHINKDLYTLYKIANRELGLGYYFLGFNLKKLRDDKTIKEIIKNNAREINGIILFNSDREYIYKLYLINNDIVDYIKDRELVSYLTSKKIEDILTKKEESYINKNNISKI